MTPAQVPEAAKNRVHVFSFLSFFFFNCIFFSFSSNLMDHVVSLAGVKRCDLVVHMHMSIFLASFSYIGCDKVLNRVPCVVE